MNKRHQIAAAVALALGSIPVHALETITVTAMEFYDAGGAPQFFGGGLNTSVVGNVNSLSTGSISSGPTPFFGTPWVATQELWDNARGARTWAGTSASGAFSYTYTLAANQVAVGLYFTWGAASEIAVLQIFDCPDAPTAGGACPGVNSDTLHPGVPGAQMANGPFTGQHAAFRGITTDVFDAIPKANNDVTSTTIDTLKVINVVSNDTDYEDGSPPPVTSANITITSGGGTVSCQGYALAKNVNGTINYQPTGGFTGSDCFDYTLTDSFGNISTVATVSITVSGVAPNVPPTVSNPSPPSINEDTPLQITAASAGTDGGDGGALTFSFFDAVTPNGTVTINGGNDTLTYTPNLNYSGGDSFTYQLSDTFDNSPVGTITVTVTPVNDAPVCTNPDFATDSNVAKVITAAELLAGCTDVDVDTLVVQSTANPVVTGSTVSSDGAGNYTYTPATGYAGNDSFDFTVADGNGGTVVATTTITVGKLLGNFTMLDVGGKVFGGTNDIVFTWDEVTVNTGQNDVNFGYMTIESKKPHPFFAAIWSAHHVRVFGPGTYTFETDNQKCASTITAANPAADDITITGCPGTGGASEMTLVVGPGQVGAHILFDWNGTFDIDVVNLWDVNAVWDDPTGQGDGINDLWSGVAGVAPHPEAIWKLVSRDAKNDALSINGSPMIDGPFIGFYANFSDTPDRSATPPPPITTIAPNSKLEDAFLGMFSGGVLLLIPAVLLFLRTRRTTLR